MLKWLMALLLVPTLALAQSDSKMLRSSNAIPDGEILISDAAYGPRYVRDSGMGFTGLTNTINVISNLAVAASNLAVSAAAGTTNAPNGIWKASYSTSTYSVDLDEIMAFSAGFWAFDTNGVLSVVSSNNYDSIWTTNSVGAIVVRMSL